MPRASFVIPVFMLIYACSYGEHPKTPVAAQGKRIETYQVTSRTVSSYLEAAAIVGPNAEVVATIYEKGRGNLREGQKIVFYTDPFPDRPFQGIIAGLQGGDDIAAGVRVHIRLTDSQNPFKAEQPLRIQIVRERKQMPVVPKTALFLDDGRFYVYRVAHGRKERLEVKPAFDFSDRVIAVEGLLDGDEIALSAMDEEPA